MNLLSLSSSSLEIAMGVTRLMDMNFAAHNINDTNKET
jgi:hypothetical protein